MTAIADTAQADLDARLFRLLLRAVRDGAFIQDVTDCADLARAAGRDAIAAKLAGVALLRSGHRAPPGTPDDRPGFSVDIAIAELRTLLPFQPRLGVIDTLLPPESPGPHQRPGVPWTQIDAAIRRSDALLVAVLDLIATDGLVDALLPLAGIIPLMAPVPPDEHVAADLDLLASLVGLHHLRRFLIANHDLLRVDCGGAPLFEVAARLHPAALGPFFSNVRLLIRDARDIFAMIDAAAPDRAARDDVETWCVLLSAHLHNHQLVDLVDELGDRGMTRALAHLLARAARADGPHYPADVVWRIRDVCLDIEEWELAAEAQQVIALWRPRDANEWGILADIRTMLNDAVGAAGALDRAVMLRPDDAGTRERMANWKAGAAPPISGGYGTPPGRRRLRRTRCEAYRAQA